MCNKQRKKKNKFKMGMLNFYNKIKTKKKTNN